MHCVILADLASLVAEHGPAFVYRGPVIHSNDLSNYWVSNRNRLDLWHQTMARYKKLSRQNETLAIKCWWRDNMPVLEEVIVAEMVSRTMACLGATVDEKHKTDSVSPVTHAVYLSILDASNRVQRLVLNGFGSRAHEASRINRLRQTVERWTDMFLGRMCCNSMRFKQYAFDAARACTFAIEYREQVDATRSVEKCLIAASMRQALCRRLSDEAAFPVANKRVADSVMGLFAPELFDTNTGTLLDKRIHQLRHDHVGDSQSLAGMTVSFPEHLAEPNESFGVNKTSDVHRWPQ